MSNNQIYPQLQQNPCSIQGKQTEHVMFNKKNGRSIKVKNLIKRQAAFAFIFLTIFLVAVGTANAQQPYLGNDGCTYFNNAYVRECPTNKPKEVNQDHYINGRWQRLFLMDYSYSGFVSYYDYAKGSWFSLDNRKKPIQTSLGLAQGEYLETGQLFITDQYGRQWVSVTGNPNGPWKDANQYVNEQTVNNMLVADMMRNHRNWEQKQWEKGLERRQQEKREEQRREDKRRYGY